MVDEDRLSAKPEQQRLLADLALLLTAIIWGSAFIFQRIAAPGSSVFLFNGLRFLIAALILLPLIWITRRRQPVQYSWNKADLIGIGIAGGLLAAGAAFQQAGLRTTTAANAGFITGLYVVFIPIIQAVLLRASPRPVIWVAAVCACIGLYLLSTGGSIEFKVGDALELVGAVFWAMHVLWIGHLVQRIPVLHLAFGQYLVCGIISTTMALMFEPALIAGIGQAGWAILYTGIISVGIGYTLQAAGQRFAPPADAAILLSSEAVFAALLGWLILDEALLPIQILGCMVMLAGMLLAQADRFSHRTEAHNAA